MKRLFFSYSIPGDADGRDFVHRLFEHLRQQDIDPWVFESSHGEIRPGAAISDTCRRKIEESDVFLVLVNDAALSSDYVDMEVSHAIWERTRRDLPIVPLIATRTLKNRWPVSLAEAADFKGVHLTGPLLAAVDTVTLHVCVALGIEYVPPKPHAPRLPLRQRLSAELQRRQSLSGYGAGDFIALMRRCDQVVEALGRDDYVKARQLIDAVLTVLEFDYAMAQPYYPRVVKGVVLLGEARSGLLSFNDAERHFSMLIDEQGDDLDANAFAGKGNALMELGRFGEAVSAYRAAEPFLESPDSALLYNMLRACVLGNIGLDPADVRRRDVELRGGIVTRSPGELSRLTAGLSLAYAYMGDRLEAMRLWRHIPDLDALFPEIVVDIAFQLHRHGIEKVALGNLDAADAIIAEYMEHREDVSDRDIMPLQQLWARIAFDRGHRDQARQQLVQLMALFPRAPVLKLDAAVLALHDGDSGAAARLCQSVVMLSDAAECLPPLSSSEFNLTLGQAFWLLGMEPEARESFRRSTYPPSLWYGITMPNEFAGAAAHLRR